MTQNIGSPMKDTEESKARLYTELPSGWAVHLRLVVLPQVIDIVNMWLFKKMSSEKDITLSFALMSQHIFFPECYTQLNASLLFQ